MPNRRLNLRREVLTDLTRRELARVPGAASGLSCFGVTCQGGGTLIDDCWSLNCTNGPCGSDFQECMTGINCA